MNQFTEDEAIDYARSGKWKELTDEQLFLLQMCQDKLCVDFGEFHRATEAVLDRPVWTHEFASPELLMQEFYGATPPTMEEIIDMIPKEKLIVIKES